ncbi:LysR family transcriptional regulator [Pseudonocardia xinjiangensis]|uniref:LysR family transcriptional regulator n=1 Tax=Pseudonocardia xinjiangensis TaxID=75289 RepID=A0ABX1RIN7_9PSEU|nr:LysR family transcriptional regulator [Pseudonocardia xinjiangensis]NMH79309.1 LysR family transcriptional regulator [Pseudonocardia xinjiangensis]
MTTLRALQCLVALIDAESVTEAAAQLHMSQSAVSHQIAALEREIGTQVVERLSRGVRPTAAGRAAANEARTALKAAARAIETGRQVGGGRAGRLRIACSETMTVWLLAPVLRDWSRRRPEVSLDLTEFTSADRMTERIAAGESDIGIGPRPTITAARIELLGQEPMVVVAACGHRFATQSSVAVTDLADEPFIHYDPANGLSSWMDEFVAQHRLRNTPVLRTGSPRTAAQLAASGVAIAIVPISALATQSARIVRRLRPDVLRDVTVQIGNPTDSLARRFVADLRRRGLPCAGGAEQSSESTA